MSKAVAKLILPVIKIAIEEVLERYPHHPCQQAFANPALKQALVAYVFNRVSGCYVLVNKEQKQQGLYSDLFKRCLEQTTHLEKTIRLGITAVLQEYAEQVIQQSEEVDPTDSPSDWPG